MLIVHSDDYSAELRPAIDGGLGHLSYRLRQDDPLESTLTENHPGYYLHRAIAITEIGT